MLVSPLSFLQRARQEARAVAAFNIYNLETLQAVVMATDTVGCPLLLQASPDTVLHAGADYLVAMAGAAARRGRTVALHLDHAQDISLIKDCLRAGFSSVMYDGSRLPLLDNIENTLCVVELARGFGAAVEAELGHVGRAEAEHNNKSMLTCPLTSEEFVSRTGVDLLAVAVGTAHGLYRGEPKLDFARLAAIGQRVSIPLVLHGGSGVPQAALRQAITLGVAKINIATELKIPFTTALIEEFGLLSGQTPGNYDPRLYMDKARSAVARAATEKAAVCWLGTRSEVR